MHPRRSLPLLLSCAAVLLAGCGGSSLLDGSSAEELQTSLTKVRTAIGEGRCAEARDAASDGAQRVEELPSSVDAALRERLKAGFDELTAQVGSDCETTTTEPPVTTTTQAAPPVEPSEPAPEPAPTITTEPETTTTEPPGGFTPDPGNGDGTGNGNGNGNGGDGGDDGEFDDGSGGVTPGVDGPGASERSGKGERKAEKERAKRFGDGGGTP